MVLLELLHREAADVNRQAAAKRGWCLRTGSASGTRQPCPDNYVRQASKTANFLVPLLASPYVPSMRLIPTHCDGCGRATLTPTSALEAGAASCSECGAQARSVPGSSYGPDDAELYDKLAQGMRDAGVTAARAASLSAELNAAPSSDAPGQGLRRMLASLPALEALELSVDAEPQVLRKLEGMLTTLLAGIGSGRRLSDMVPAAVQQGESRSGQR